MRPSGYGTGELRSELRRIRNRGLFIIKLWLAWSAFALTDTGSEERHGYWTVLGGWAGVWSPRGSDGVPDYLRGVFTPFLKWERLEEKAAQLARTTVDQVMAQRVVSADEDTDVIEVAGIMANKGIHPIPVLHNGRLLGVIGRADIVKVLLDLSEKAENDATGNPR